ncbi:MAG: hypothetical protein IJG49_02335 [Erysipelotrichaceae bacterium]|nr:hypothetical protein [Erysipelotrichaceae bacterium]
MKTVIELIVYCGIFTLLVKVFAGNDPLNCLYFYPKEVQERVYELGLTDREAVKKKKKMFLIIFTSAMLMVLLVIIRFINRTDDYWQAYWQALLFLEVMNVYDGVVIDKIWVGYDRFWLIDEVKDIPYIQSWKQVFRKRSILAFIWVLGSFIVAGLVILI